MSNQPVMWTNAAFCRDCNRCVSVCPVKAVRKLKGQAQVVSERCLLCGICLRECPQGAKSYLKHGAEAAKLLAQGQPVIASVAPSYAAAFTPHEIRALPSVLRQLGFAQVTQTAVAAEWAAAKAREFAREHPGRHHLLGFCPALVSYILHYRPDLAGAIIPVASPMVLHARHLKLVHPGSAVVFIGPCLAKKAEARLGHAAGSVDLVLTFEELRGLIAEAGVNLATAEESDFDDGWAEAGRYFPVEGGFARAAGLSADLLNLQVLSISGPDQVLGAIESLSSADEPCLLEALVCPGGCVGGPGISRPRNIHVLATKRTFLETLARQAKPVHQASSTGCSAAIGCAASYAPAPLADPPLDEAKIREVLVRMGKASAESEVDCGACGYPSCREKAKAVLRGMADEQMCMPLMRKYAEGEKHALIENSPNAMVILDRDLVIMHANPRFCEMFMTSLSCLGKRISYFMDDTPFARVQSGEIRLFDETVQHVAYGLTCQQVIYPLGGDEGGQLAAVLVNLTSSKRQEADLDALRRAALQRAEEAIDRQVDLAQEMAKLLGRAAGDTRLILQQLTELVRGKDGS
jgi:iron only hydrogenase large subunit-like protein